MKASNIQDLARRDIEVLVLLADYTNDGNRHVPARSLRDAIEWADSNADIRYRWDKLEERGLIETRQANEAETNGAQIPPRVASVTDAGSEMAEGVEFAQPADVLERMERLEKQVATMRQTYGEVKHRIVQLEDAFDEVQGEIEDVDGDVDELARQIERLADTVDH